MTQSGCPKCGSTVTVPNVRLIDRGESNCSMDLSVAVYKRPDAWVFTGAVYQPLNARICGGCGYTELYVANPHELMAAARQSTPDEPDAQFRVD
jgi:predicted nucleic-acid-binding Zn-ribbon protein